MTPTLSVPSFVQLWMGYQQSLRPCEGGLALNVDGACTAFLEECPVPDFMAKAAGVFNIEQLAHIGDMQKKRCNKAMIGIKARSPYMFLSKVYGRNADADRSKETIVFPGKGCGSLSVIILYWEDEMRIFWCEVVGLLEIKLISLSQNVR